MLKLSWVNVKSALVYGGLWALLAVMVEIKAVGNIFALDWQALANVGVMAFIAFVIVLLKNLFTTDNGNFMGVVKVAPPTK